MLNTPFSPWPSFTSEEADAVHRVLLGNRVNYWTGDECREFEKEFAAWAGTAYALALANGTLALDVALKALGIGPGDEVIVTPRTFIASVSCVVNAGATPVFADIDSNSGNINAQTIAAVLTPRTKAVICVHLAGWPCNMDPIMALAAQRGLKVIEDCAQANGARYKGRSVGSIGHVGAWSFCQDKIMTTGGEGGMVTCNDESLWRAMWAYKDHGKTYAAVYEREHPPGFRWLHESFGTNWRMLEIQGAIGRIQLRRMRAWTAARGANAMALREALLPFADEGGVVRVPQMQCDWCPVRGGCQGGEAVAALGAAGEGVALRGGSRESALPAEDDSVHGCQHAFYKFYAYVRPENLAPGWSRDRIIEEIHARGVPCYMGSCSEVYMEKAFDSTGWRPKERLPVAKELGETSMMFLVHPTLTQAEIRKTQDAITQVLRCAVIR
ncbi:WecE Predicted pyridoxal phosphate-dependent enzyme apparently involved in regulation of cell wall biogenesis [Burkholderiales bacterium]